MVRLPFRAIARDPTLRHDFIGTAMPSWGLVTSHKAARVLPPKALLDPMVGEACAYVQGESLKAQAALLVRLTNSPVTRMGSGNLSDWKEKEREARRAIEDHGFAVQDANVLFRENCPNIDLVVFGKTTAFYVQVKSSENPASKDSVVIDGSPWTEAQLRGGAPIFNKHGDASHYEASLIVILDRKKDGVTNFYIAPPKKLEELVRAKALTFADKPKRDGTPRSIKFRKETSRKALEPWRDAWHLLDQP